MAATGPETVSSSEPPESSRQRRAHTYSRLTTAIAVLALATAGYALIRLDAARDRLDDINSVARTLEADRNTLRAELKSLSNRERAARREVDRRLSALDAAPQQLQELASSVEELRGRAEGPERAWSRAEAMFLLELAQRRLSLDRDITTAVVALESADLRLASLRDASLAPARQQIARELQSLRAVNQPDTTGILTRLVTAEEHVSSVPVKGILATERAAFDRSSLPDGMLPRAWAMLSQTLSNLVVVRRVDDRAGSVVTAEEALLRREHLQLLLFAARTAVTRHDDESYRTSLSGARRMLDGFFDMDSPAAQALLEEIQALEPIDIDPALPDISGSSRALRRLMPARRGPE
jgi:uroporphyrin-III C-methyltransferase